MNLSRLSSLILEQENVVKTIQNNIDLMRLAAVDDYQGLDAYFREIELLESKMLASSGNLSSLELETITPTFLICNEKFRLNITDWASCNARFVADGINKKIILKFEQLPQQTTPLVAKAKSIQNEFYVIANPLNKTYSRIPLGIEPAAWKDIREEISKDMGHIDLLTLKADQVLNLTKRPAKSIVWDILRTPYSSGIAYNVYFQSKIDARLSSLNHSKSQLREGIKELSSKFEEIEFPVIGKIPVGLANAVVVFPAAIGVGSLVCSYYLGQTISKRLVFHRIFKKLHPERSFDGELYPVWANCFDTVGLRCLSRCRYLSCY